MFPFSSLQIFFIYFILLLADRDIEKSNFTFPFPLNNRRSNFMFVQGPQPKFCMIRPPWMVKGDGEKFQHSCLPTYSSCVIIGM
jgi:hypothetical protein